MSPVIIPVANEVVANLKSVALNNWPGNAASRRNGYAALGQSDCFKNWRSENNSAVVDLLHAINQVQILELGGRKHKFIGPVPRLKVKVA